VFSAGPLPACTSQLRAVERRMKRPPAKGVVANERLSARRRTASRHLDQCCLDTIKLSWQTLVAGVSRLHSHYQTRAPSRLHRRTVAAEIFPQPPPLVAGEWGRQRSVHRFLRAALFRQRKTFASQRGNAFFPPITILQKFAVAEPLQSSTQRTWTNRSARFRKEYLQFWSTCDYGLEAHIGK